MKKNKFTILLLIFAVTLASVAPTTLLARPELGATLRHTARATAAPIGSVESLNPSKSTALPSDNKVWCGMATWYDLPPEPVRKCCCPPSAKSPCAAERQ